MWRTLSAAAMAAMCVIGCSGSRLTGDDGSGGGEFGGDAGADIDAPTDPNAIQVPPDQLDHWVWVPIDGAMCGDGSPAGVGVRFTAKSRNLVVWFQGNGVCYDMKSCVAFQQLLVGMGPDPINHMWWGDDNQGHTGIFDPDDPTNPF